MHDYLESKFKSSTQIFATNEIILKPNDHLSMELYLLNGFRSSGQFRETSASVPNHNQGYIKSIKLTLTENSASNKVLLLKSLHPIKS